MRKTKRRDYLGQKKNPSYLLSTSSTNSSFPCSFVFLLLDSTAYQGSTILLPVLSAAFELSLPNQQRALTKLSTKLRCRNLVNKCQWCIQVGTKRARSACNVCVSRLSFHFAYHRWWLGMYFFASEDAHLFFCESFPFLALEMGGGGGKEGRKEEACSIFRRPSFLNLLYVLPAMCEPDQTYLLCRPYGRT